MYRRLTRAASRSPWSSPAPGPRERVRDSRLEVSEATERPTREVSRPGDGAIRNARLQARRQRRGRSGIRSGQRRERAASLSPRPGGCVLLDDSTSNLRVARQLGWRTVLVGLRARDTGEVLPPYCILLFIMLYYVMI